MKKCTKCGEEKPLTEFRKRQQSPDGLRPSCKACCRKQDAEYGGENRERLRLYQQNYRRMHPDNVAATLVRVRAKRVARNQSGHVPETKFCPCCERTKPAAAFSRAKSTSDGLSGYCAECCVLYNKTWFASEKGRACKRRADSSQRLKKYGLTTDSFDALLLSQGNKCAICGVECSHSGKPEWERRELWHIDHDHSSGAVRGVLCMRCNVGLGHFLDNPSLLQTAIAYLERPPAYQVVCSATRRQ